MARELLYYGLSLILAAYATHQLYSFSTHSLSGTSRVYHALQAVATLCLAVSSYRKARYAHKARLRGCQPGVVHRHLDPILGLDWLFESLRAVKQNQILEHWRQQFKREGNTIWVNTLGKWILMTNEPENMKAILASSFDDWPIAGPRLDAVLPILGPGAIFSSNGKAWHDGRAMMRPNFVRNQIADFECFDRHVSRLVDKIPKNGEKVDLQNLFFKMTMDSSTDFMFGHSTNTLAHPTPEADEFCKMFDYVNTRSANRARLGIMARFDRDKEFERGLKVVHDFVDNYVHAVEAEKRTPERSYVFLHEMMDSHQDPNYIRSQLLALILAGRDTTAGILSSLFWVLARRPDIVKSLRAEILQLPSEQNFTWEDIKEMKYLNMVLKEALRLYPPVAAMSRTSARDTVLPVGGGSDGKSSLFVPEGTPVRWSLWSLHRREDIYGPDALEFRPERWKDLRVTWEYGPFSGGPRICIGQQFALTQMSYVLIKIFREFDSVEARDDRPMRMGMTITTRLANDLWVGFSKA